MVTGTLLIIIHLNIDSRPIKVYAIAIGWAVFAAHCFYRKINPKYNEKFIK